MLSILFKCKLFLILLTGKDEQECIHQISGCVTCAGAVLICSRIDAISDTEAEIWVSTWAISWIYLNFVGARLLN